jgi:chorismate mutase / prephenate dehydratase
MEKTQLKNFFEKISLNFANDLSIKLEEIGNEKSKIFNLAKELSQKYQVDESFLLKLFESIKEFNQNIQLRERKPSAQESDNESPVRVAFQGIDGAYSQLAAKKYFSGLNKSAVCIGMPTFQSILDAVENNDCDFAMLPIENTTAGSINESYDLLTNTKLSIVGEEVYEVNHCLMSVENVPLSRIKRIYSHPQAIAQCSIFLSSLESCKVESFYDTAMAIKKVQEEQDLSQAAIGSSEAAKLYGLEIIKEGIANYKENYTRFFIISKNPVKYDKSVACKTSLILSTKHVEGALVNCLNVLAKHHLNMTKIQSRPRPNMPWEYLFYLDFEGNIADEAVKKCLEELTSESSYIKILGSYPIKVSSNLPRSTEEREATLLTEIEMAPEPAKPEVKLEKKPYKLVSRGIKKDDTLIKIQDIVIGGGDFVIMAGPCAVESEDQINITAEAVAKYGGHILRGGVFKPRTSPYSFQGMGYEGLELLSKAGRKNNLPIITEVIQPKDVHKVSMTTDILQIGARNMQNFSLLTEVGGVNKPVLLKRGMMASIDELLSAAEYILAHGNQQVMLCERGIRTFETATRNTLDLSAVPILKYYSHLPVIVDPSHAVGDSRWIVPMVEAAYAAGADGVIVEIHPDPPKAMSDGKQSLTFDEYAYMMKRVNMIKQLKR